MSAAEAAPSRRDIQAKAAIEAVVRPLALAGQAVLLPEWEAPASIGLLTTTRAAASAGAIAPTAVTTAAASRSAERYRRLDHLLPSNPVWLRQVHGAGVVILDAQTLPLARATPPVADAAVTRLSNVICAVRTADCLPVAITDRAGTAIGVAHAGWRGLAAGVLEATVHALGDLGVAPGDLVVWLGPAIGPTRFEVGPDVTDAFCAHDPGAWTCFVAQREGKWLADLYGLARRRLAAMSVRNIHGGGFCTYRDAARFPSYRRERSAERMATLLWRNE